MPMVADRELVFSRDQIISSSQAAKNFGEVRRRAAERPLFVSGRSGIDTVVLGYEEFERLCLELDELRTEKIYDKAAKRLESEPDRISLEDVMGNSAYEDFLTINPDAIPDEEFFE